MREISLVTGPGIIPGLACTSNSGGSLVTGPGPSWGWPTCLSTGQHTDSRGSLVPGPGIISGLAYMSERWPSHSHLRVLRLSTEYGLYQQMFDILQATSGSCVGMMILWQASPAKGKHFVLQPSYLPCLAQIAMVHLRPHLIKMQCMLLIDFIHVCDNHAIQMHKVCKGINMHGFVKGAYHYSILLPCRQQWWI